MRCLCCNHSWLLLTLHSVFNALFLVYAIIQIAEIREIVPTEDSSAVPINVLTTIIPIVISIAELAYIGLGWKIYNEFGWKVYKFLGADRRIKKMYANYQIYECLVKFDVFFWAGFSVQFIWLVLQKTDWEYYVTCAAMPLSLILLVEGHLAARHENKWMMATFMSGCVGAMVYFVYKVCCILLLPEMSLTCGIKLVKVLMYKNTDDLKLVWKTLMVFCEHPTLFLYTINLNVLCSGYRDCATSCDFHSFNHGHAKFWSRIEECM